MRFRFTVRRMMAVVAVAALAILGTQRAVDMTTRRAVVMRQRSSEYLMQARVHDVSGRATELLANVAARHPTVDRASAEDERRRALDAAEWHKQKARLYKEKGRLYARAAARPWLRVEDDPDLPPYHLPAPAPPWPAGKENQPENSAPPSRPVDDGYHLEWPTLRREQSPTPDPKGEGSDAGGLPGSNLKRVFEPT